ncbi:unnamed protein product, partial [Amoebophrya sp. A25]|eukprot:GSA25T00002214001.1
MVDILCYGEKAELVPDSRNSSRMPLPSKEATAAHGGSAIRIGNGNQEQTTSPTHSVSDLRVSIASERTTTRGIEQRAEEGRGDDVVDKKGATGQLLASNNVSRRKTDTTILFTIHQPSSLLYSCFQDVYFLGRG